MTDDARLAGETERAVDTLAEAKAVSGPETLTQKYKAAKRLAFISGEIND